MEHLSEHVILKLAKTIDAKDKYTNGHSERVVAYSREIAKRMGMSEQEQHEIYYMGLFMLQIIDEDTDYQMHEH